MGQGFIRQLRWMMYKMAGKTIDALTILLPSFANLSTNVVKITVSQSWHNGESKRSFQISSEL
jgi:hypothetical protein